MGSSRNRILWLYINPLFLLINLQSVIAELAVRAAYPHNYTKQW